MIVNYEQIIIYYFSGTGNAKNAARWIAGVAEEKGIAAHLINIDRFETIDIPVISGKVLIGFCSPTHGFNLPPIMLNFILKFPKINNADAFILNTRGGLKLSKLFIPGISGLAQILPAVILRAKGLKIIGMQPLDLPSNWLILHPGLRKKVIDSIYDRCHKIVKKFASKIISGERKYKALLSLPIDIALIPIALGYYFFGRFFLAKTLIATKDCNNCDLCINKCPVQAIKKVDERPYWTYTCENCMRCVNDCPQRAIETTHTVSALLIIVSTLVISPLVILGLKYLGALDLVDQFVFAQNILAVIDATIFLLFVFVSYRLLHYLLRYTPINRIVAYSSLSKYKFWRRYKAP